MSACGECQRKSGSRHCDRRPQPHTEAIRTGSHLRRVVYQTWQYLEHDRGWVEVVSTLESRMYDGGRTSYVHMYRARASAGAGARARSEEGWAEDLAASSMESNDTAHRY